MLKEYLLKIVDEQKFADAVEKCQEILSEFPTNENRISKLQRKLIELRKKIKDFKVVTPSDYDNLYYLVKSNLEQISDDITEIEGFEKYFSKRNPKKENMKIDRVINGENLAVCKNILTKDGYTIGFSFNFEEIRPEHDKKTVEKYPDYFYLEDCEVLAVKEEIQNKEDLSFFLQLADNHPTGAIEIFNQETEISYQTNEKFVGLESEESDWYW